MGFSYGCVKNVKCNRKDSAETVLQFLQMIHKTEEIGLGNPGSVFA